MQGFDSIQPALFMTVRPGVARDKREERDSRDV
jgi:hypothetical protein